jgi:hypothetical protein
MSRGYRISYPVPTWRNVSAHVESADAVAMDVGLLDILPEAEMLALLRTRLRDDGWSQAGDGGLSRRFGDVTAELAPDGRTVTVRAVAARGVEARGTDDAQANSRLEQAKRDAQRDLAKTVGKKLIAAEADVRASVQTALQKVYVEALKRKAASLGEIEGMQETRGADGELELTIKVRVP